jgi:hypothetical protein
MTFPHYSRPQRYQNGRLCNFRDIMGKFNIQHTKKMAAMLPLWYPRSDDMNRFTLMRDRNWSMRTTASLPEIFLSEWVQPRRAPYEKTFVFAVLLNMSTIYRTGIGVEVSNVHSPSGKVRSAECRGPQSETGNIDE